MSVHSEFMFGKRIGKQEEMIYTWGYTDTYYRHSSVLFSLAEGSLLREVHLPLKTAAISKHGYSAPCLYTTEIAMLYG